MKHLEDTLAWQGLVVYNTTWGHQHRLGKTLDKPLGRPIAMLPFSIAVTYAHNTIVLVMCFAYSTFVASLFMFVYVSSGAVATFFFVPKLAAIASLHKHTEVHCMTSCLHRHFCS